MNADLFFSATRSDEQACTATRSIEQACTATRVQWEQLLLLLTMLLAPNGLSHSFDCSAQTRTGMGCLRKPLGVELIPAVD